MDIHVFATDLEMTDELRSYVEQKVGDVRRAFGDMDLTSVTIDVEVARTTRHHRKGDKLYRAEATVRLPRQRLRVEEYDATPKTAVSKLKQSLSREIRTWRERLADLRRKGARRATDNAE